MRGELIAIDLETTGLDAGQDSILEIAAVRFRDGVIVEEFSTLVDPGRPVPALITHITGITDEDVHGAPSIHSAIPRLLAFVGDSPIMAHSISQDAMFLGRQGALQTNLRLDTYEIAAVLLPRAPRYTLTAVAAQLGVPLVHAHRALDDARATALVYDRLWQRALALPRAVLAEIVAAAANFKWDARPMFEAALREVDASGRTGTAPAPFSVMPPTAAVSGADYHPPTAPPPTAEVFAPEGPLAARMPGYEYREGQAQMAQAVDAALQEGQHLIVEAATGVGKSLAYLVPALRHAAETGRRVVISTSTLTLQDQLVQRDFPALTQALGIDAQAAVLKGRGNYLCPRRFNALRARGPMTLEELTLLVKLLVWETDSPTGDKQDLTLRGAEHELWAHLSAEDEDCDDTSCLATGGICPFYRARQRARTVPVVVVNHALLVADAMSAQKVLPEHDTLIIDEAQHLEDATTHGLSFTLDAPGLQRRLREVSDSRGLLGALLRAIRSGGSERDIARFEEYSGLVRGAARAMSGHIGAMFGALGVLAADLRAERSDVNQIRITPELRTKAAFEQAQAAWQTLSEFMEAVSGALAQLAKGLRRLDNQPIPDRLDLIRAAESSSRYFANAGTHINAFFTQPDPNSVYWIGIGHEERGVILNAAPAYVGSLVETHLLREKRAVVVTGATLQSGGSFDFLRERLGLHDAPALTIASPFDHRSAVLHYVPNDLPDPADRGRYQATVERAIVELATALDGRLLVLFTSYAQLRQTSQAITARLALGDITVYDQLDSGGRGAAMEGFRTAPRSVLMGTRSFWEGVDFPAETLRGVIIVRLPFSVPTDPIFGARSERYHDGFNEYSVPEAALKFRQGFGRLIRRATDRGVFVVLDGRLTSKSYGRIFLESIPETTRQNGPLSGLAEAAREWVAK